MNLLPVVLEGKQIRLEPLSLDHWAPLCEVGLDPEIWRLTASLVQTRNDMRRYIETALAWQRDGTALPFVLVEKPSMKAVGSTRYANVDHRHRRIEIGWTWMAPAWQRTGLNTEAKFLLLQHAFETLSCIRVEFKTDAVNMKSRTALLRIGAKEEGTLRRHMIVPSGRVRDTVYYSVIAEEWPEVRAALEKKLTRPG
jgi:RimJ/RimL family protein N-acetyltransferase